MISCLSAAVNRTYRPPSRRPADFFEYAILKDRLGHDLLEVTVLAAQVLDFGRRRFARRIAQPPLLTGLEELLAPAVIEIRRYPFAAAERRDALFPAEPLQHDPNLLFGRKPPAGVPPNLPNHLLRRSCRRHGGLLPWQESVSYFTTLRGPHWVDATQC